MGPSVARLRLLGVVAVVVATAGMCAPNRVETLPSPDELGAPALPEGWQPGGVDAVYATVRASSSGSRSDCYDLIRLHPDGEARRARRCSDRGPEPLAERNSTWDADETDVGDYAHQDGRLVLRLASWDPLTEAVSLHQLEAVACARAMAVREPAVRQPAGIARYELVTGTPVGDEPGCDLPPFGFESLPLRVFAGPDRRAEVVIRTEPGVACSLRVSRPGGAPWPTAGDAQVEATADGRCVLSWPVGTITGTATLTITVGSATHDIDVEVG